MRFRLRTLMIVVTLAAMASAALTMPTRFTASLVFAVTLLSLLTCVLAIIYQRGQSQALAVGFLVFCGGYLATLVILEGRIAHDFGIDKMPSARAVDWLYLGTHAGKTKQVISGNNPNGPFTMNAVPVYSFDNFSAVAHCIIAIALGIVGGCVASFLAHRRPSRDNSR